MYNRNATVDGEYQHINISSMINNIPLNAKFVKINPPEFEIKYVDLRKNENLEEFFIYSESLYKMDLPIKSNLIKLSILCPSWDEDLEIDFSNQNKLTNLEIQFTPKINTISKDSKLVILNCCYNFFEKIPLEVKKRLIGLNIINLDISYDFSICENLQSLTLLLDYEPNDVNDNTYDNLIFPKKLFDLSINQLHDLKICKKIEQLKDIEQVSFHDTDEKIYLYIWNFSNNTKLKLENIVFDRTDIELNRKIIKRKRIYLLCQNKVGKNENKVKNYKEILRLCIRCKKQLTNYNLINIRKGENFLYYTCC